MSTTETNKHGLARYIPAAVARAVRQRCKFCCVLCQSSFCQYHHFDPPFEDATTHDPEGITLLCLTCHGMTGYLRSHSEISAADRLRRSQAPTGNILLSVRPPLITVLGSILFSGMGSLLTIEGTPVLSVNLTEAGIPALFAAFFDAHGNPTLVIEDNMLRVRADNWDVKLEGAVMTVRSGPRQIAMELQFHPPHGLHVRRLTMLHRGWRFETNDEGKIVTGPVGGELSLFLEHSVMELGGHLDLSEGRLTARGGYAQDSGYSDERLCRLARLGQFDAIRQDIRRPVLHVLSTPQGWVVQMGSGQRIAQSSSKAAARNFAIAELRKDAALRLVVHQEDGTIESLFGDEV